MAAETRANTCEGASGTTVTTSNTAGPNQFTAASATGAGASVAFSNTRAHTGTTSIQQTLPAGVLATASYDWGSLSADNQKFTRWYVWLDAYPTVTTRIIAFLGSALLRSTVQITTTGTIRTLTSGGGTIATTTAAVPLGQWCRIEFEVLNISGTTGTVAARMFSGANLEGWTPDTGGALYNTGQTVGGTIDTVRIGQSSAVTMTSTWQPYYDDIAESNQSQPGPLNGCMVVVVGDMQPAAGTTAPPTVVAAQIAALSPQPNYVLIPGDCTDHGDNTGFSGEFTNFNSMYGALKPLLYPVPGNHDWGNVPGQGTTAAFDTYWGAQSFSGATPPHFYSFDTSNGWHVIAFDSSEQWTGSLASPSATYTAVANDLAANTGKPLIAFWHHPRWSDGTDTTDPGGTSDTTVVKDIWNLLRDHKADLVFSGHCHSYQRFGKLGKFGSADPAGIAEIVVGTGGSGLFTLTGPGRAQVNSYQAAAYDQLNSKWFGFLQLFLTPTTYSWQFVSQNGAGSQAPGQVLDSGGPVTSNLSAPAFTPGTLTATTTAAGGPT